MKDFKYITVLDFEAGKVFQYELPERKPFEDIGYENYLTNEGHNLKNCEWMVHKNPEIVTP
jgi:hypothetical protein|tara:strand:+ start:584 stop:766 length:183 start_codon:yes stop_codon:yes gene_type:complete